MQKADSQSPQGEPRPSTSTMEIWSGLAADATLETSGIARGRFSCGFTVTGFEGALEKATTNGSLM